MSFRLKAEATVSMSFIYPIIDTALCSERAVDPLRARGSVPPGRREVAAAARQE